MMREESKEGANRIISPLYKGKIKEIFPPNEKYTFLVGAGISIDPPTNLPSAREIVNILLEVFTPKDIDVSQIGEKKRFEAVIEVIKQNFDKELRFMDYMDLVTDPNYNHLFLAYVITGGHFVLTTNFDYMIERALMQILPIEQHQDIIIVITKDDFLAFQRPQDLLLSNKYPLYKIHGSKRNIVKDVDTSESLVTTISDLGKGREKGETFAIEPYKKLTVYNLIRGRTLIVMGYSGNDVFDIGPTLKEIRNLKRIIWIDHAQQDGIEVSKISRAVNSDKSAKFNQVQLLLSEICSVETFEVYYVRANTMDIVKNILWNIFIPNIPIENIKIGDVPSGKSPSFKDWVSSLSINTDEVLKYLLASKLLGHSDEAIRTAEKGLEIAREKADSKLIIYFHLILGYIFSGFEFNRALEHFKEALSICDEFQVMEDKSAVLLGMGNMFYIWGKKDKALERFEEALNIPEFVKLNRVQCLVEMARIHEESEDYNKAISLLMESLTITEEIGDLEVRAIILESIGYINFMNGNLKTALENYQKALKIDEKLGNEFGKGARLYNIAGIYRSFGDNSGDYDSALKNYNLALNYYQEALIIAEKFGELNSISKRLDCIGNVYYEIGDYDNALEYLKRGLEVSNQLVAKKLPVLDVQINCLTGIGKVYLARKEFDNALKVNEEAIQIAIELNRFNDQIKLLNRNGVIYRKKGNNIKALEYYNKSLKIYEKIACPSITNITLVMDIFLNKGELLYENKNFDESLETYRRALSLSEKILNLSREVLVQKIVILQKIGRIFLEIKEFDKALESCKMALEIYPQLGDLSGDELMIIGEIFYNNAYSYLELGQYNLALEYFNKVLNIDKQLGDDVGRIAKDLAEIGKVYEAKKDYISAKKYFLEAQQVYRGLGKIFKKVRNFRSALESYKSALRIYEIVHALQTLEETKEEFSLKAEILYDIGFLYSEFEKYDEALETFDEVLRFDRELGDLKNMGGDLYEIGYIFKKQGKDNRALEKFNEALNIYKKLGLTKEVETLQEIIQTLKI